MEKNCPLCSGTGDIFYNFKKRLYYQCQNCSAIFVDKKLRPDAESEKERYNQHNNDVNDKNYQKFVSPITYQILTNFKPSDKGLDFGAGTGPVITKVLSDENYSLNLYDPYFHNTPSVLNEQYDYIVCCEVIEHFYHPKKEFELLHSMLADKGILYCMTDIYDESIDFHKWYYKNDDTHVFIYHANTLKWICKEMNFSRYTIEGRLIIFYK